MNKPEAIIYDFDGTILDTLPYHLRAYRLALREFDIEASDDEIIRKCFNVLDPIAAANFGISDVERFSQTYHQGAREGFTMAEPTPDIIDTLNRLKDSGYTICLGSLARRSEFDAALDRFDLTKYFFEILTYDEHPGEKPAIFSTLAQKANLDPGRTLIVGDAANDI